MHSRIDGSLLVTKDQWVVSLVRITFHTVIVVESMADDRPDEGLRTRWFDFVTDEKHKQSHEHHHQFTQRCSYFARNCALLFKNIKGVITDKIVQGQVRECHPYKHPWYPDDSWLCDAAKVQQMLDEIHKDMQTPPLLQYKGGPDSVNCTTWAWDKLAIADIDARNESKKTPVTILANHSIGSRKN